MSYYTSFESLFQMDFTNFEIYRHKDRKKFNFNDVEDNFLK